MSRVGVALGTGLKLWLNLENSYRLQTSDKPGPVIAWRAAKFQGRLNRGLGKNTARLLHRLAENGLFGFGSSISANDCWTMATQKV